MNGGNPSSLFEIGNLRKSVFRDNKVVPLGGRLLTVDSGGIYEGITLDSSNQGAVITSAKATGKLPLDGCVLWMESDLTVDASNATRGDETVLAVNDNQRYGDTIIITESTLSHAAQTWVDRLTHFRLFQETSTKRPTYEMGSSLDRGGDDADTLNSRSILRADGTDDLLYGPTELSNAEAGCIYAVVKRRNDTNATQAIFGSADEATQNTYLRLETHAPTGQVRFRLRNGSADTETFVPSTSSQFPVSTWKIVRLASNGTNTTIYISDGAGAMVNRTGTVTGTDGRWFADCGTLLRDGFYLFGEKKTTGSVPEEQTWGAYDMAAFIVYEGDQSANFSAIESYLFSQYGSL